MKKLFCLLLCLGLVIPGYAADQWTKGSPAGTDSPSDIDDLLAVNNNAADRLFADYVKGIRISYSSATTIIVSDGQVVCDNVDRDTRKWRENTANITVTFSNLDTGSEEASTTYYVYAVADTDATTFTITISKSGAPSGATYYKRLGSFYNDASSNIDEDSIDNYLCWVEDGEITYEKLKIASGVVSYTVSDSTLRCVLGSDGSGSSYVAQYVPHGASNAYTHLTLPGGAYGFYPQSRYTGGKIYARQYYVTASGIDYWLYVLTAKKDYTHLNQSYKKGEIISIYGAPDHPSYGNKCSPEDMPHPFTDYDNDTQQIILVEKECSEQLKDLAVEADVLIAELIMDEYKVDFSTVEDYVPLHSGEFLNDKPVMVKELPPYIKVKKLIPMTMDDKVALEAQEDIRRATDTAIKAEEKLVNDKIRTLAIAELEKEGKNLRHINK